MVADPGNHALQPDTPLGAASERIHARCILTMLQVSINMPHTALEEEKIRDQGKIPK